MSESGASSGALSAAFSAAVPDAAAQIAGLAVATLLIDPSLAIVEANPAAEELLGRSARRLEGVMVGEVVQVPGINLEGRLRECDGPLVARNVDLFGAERESGVNLTASPLPAHPGWHVVSLERSTQGIGFAEDLGEVGAPAILAHEIKNPLAAIRGAGQLLARRVAEADRPLTDIVASEVERIAGIVDRMQQLGRTLTMPLGPVSLHEAIRNAMATVRAARSDAAILVEEFDPSLPPVLADRETLEQVLINLIANACDAVQDTPGALVEIRTRFVSGLTVKPLNADRATLLPIEITVSDNGPGVPASIRHDLFRPFISSKSHGQGLGLALVRKLVGDMGGRVVHERDGARELTRFHINLAVAGGEGA